MYPSYVFDNKRIEFNLLSNKRQPILGTEGTLATRPSKCCLGSNGLRSHSKSR